MLREKFMVKQTYANEDLSLEAEAGKSLLVKDIIVLNPVAAGAATISIDKDTVGYFRVIDGPGNHLSVGRGALNDLATYDAIASVNFKTILGLMFDKGIFRGYPVGEGQTIKITGVAQAGCLQMFIYEEHDAADILPTMPNGTLSTEYEFLNYGRVAADIITSADTIYDTVQSPAQFPDFPFGKDVAAGSRVEIHGILASDMVDYRNANDAMNSDYLKLIKERTTLFDQDKNGIFLKGLIGTVTAAAILGHGYSLIGNYSDIDQKPPIMFDPPLEFLAGEELGIYLTTTAGAVVALTELLVADTEIALIERVIKV